MYVPKITRFWKPAEVFVLRTAWIFFVMLSIPYDLNLYCSLSGPLSSFENLFQLATFRTSFIPESLYAGINPEGYLNWLIALFAAVAGAFFWSSRRPIVDHAGYDRLYYWLRVLLRYRLALAALFIGVVKVLPIQIPELTLSDLHTGYGDFLLWKLYYLTNAISTAGYLPVIGLLEIAGGLLLLNRRTSVMGSGLLLAIFLNVVLVNYVYDIGEQVYSSFLFLLSVVIFWHDVPRLYRLLFREIQVEPDRFVPFFDSKVRIVRPYLRALFLLTAAFFSVQAYASWQGTNYPYPNRRGIPDVAGYYDVKDFVWKGDTIAYSLTDSVRWQDVVFEEWNTLSLRDNRPVKIDSLKPRIVYQRNRDRNYEQSGNGGRHFYRYEYSNAEEGVAPVMVLENKTDPGRHYHFTFSQPAPGEIVLEGTDWLGDSLSVHLERIPKKYLLREGRRNPLKIY